MKMFVCENINPISKRVGDCTVRAISKALEQDWERTYIELCLQGFLMCDMPSANHVWGAYLRSKGFCKAVFPEDCPNDYSIKDFCRDNPSGRYILAMPGHVVPVVDGKYYDTWDSGDEIPVYLWYRKDM